MAEPVAEPTPVTSTPAAPKQDLVETLFRYKEFVLVGIGLVMALILALLAVRRRRLEDEDEDEFTAEDYEAPDFEEGQTFQFEEMSEDDFITDPDNQKVDADQETDDFLFAEDESATESFDLDDNETVAPDSAEDDEETTDVITQADHYIVYGKFDQAVKMLKDGAEEQPQRTDIRLKLLELLATLDESDEFAEAEAGLVALGDADANAQAAELRKQLSVQPEQVTSDATDPLAFDEELNTQTDDVTQFDGGMDFGEALDLPETDEQAPVSEASSDLDFMFDETPADEELALDETVEPEAVESETDEPETKEPESIEALGAETAEETVSESPVFEQFPAAEYPREDSVSDTESAPSSDDSLTFDLEADLSEEAPAEAEDAPLTDATFDIDFADDDALEIEDDLPQDAVSYEPAPSDNAPRVPELSLVSNGPEMPVELDVSDESLSDAALDDVSLDEVSLEGDTADGDALLSLDDAEITSETQDADLTAGIDLDELETADDEFDFLSGTDECATKLDLARAYVDMEDFEGAKELLEEVVQEGSDQQKQDALDLMDKIA